MIEAIISPLSESMQMYLVTIARLRVDGQPVPLSQLSETLSISPVSVNEMCRKLQEQGLVIYRPYKGASLTSEGEIRANHVMRLHRLWEVFLVEKLGFENNKAHNAACQLEHATPNLVADRLDIFLEHPKVNPLGQPIPRAEGDLTVRTSRPLSELSAGQRGHVIHCQVSEAARIFLAKKGIRPGASLTMLATSEDSFLVWVDETHVSLARALAEELQMEMERVPSEAVVGAPGHSSLTEEKQKATSDLTFPKRVSLDKLEVGQHGIVVRIGGKGPVRRRMMDMGLVTGAEVKVVRVAPLGDPIEFEVKGYKLSLRKSEARNVNIEVIEK